MGGCEPRAARRGVETIYRPIGEQCFIPTTERNPTATVITVGKFSAPNSPTLHVGDKYAPLYCEQDDKYVFMTSPTCMECMTVDCLHFQIPIRATAITPGYHRRRDQQNQLFKSGICVQPYSEPTGARNSHCHQTHEYLKMMTESLTVGIWEPVS